MDKHAALRLRDVKMLTQYLLPFLKTGSIAGMGEQKAITGLLDLLSHPFTHYDGILYPSVQDRLGTSNLALTQNGFLNNFIPTEVTHDVLISIKNGGAMFQGVHRSCKFDLTGGIKEGTIIWDD